MVLTEEMKIFAALCLVTFVYCDRNIEEITKKRISTRIINGENADIRSFPWQASLRCGESFHHICGAAVVSTRTAITAAHCISRNRRYSLQVGSSTLSNDMGTIVPVAKIIKHPDFKSVHGKNENDIAILQFDQDIAGTSNKLAKTVPIPKNDKDFSGSSCSITGYGRVNAKVKLPSDRLQMASTTVLTNADCKRKFDGIFDSHVCAYTGFNGACYGDSGGPLTCDKVLVGVTSFGKKTV